MLTILEILGKNIVRTFYQLFQLRLQALESEFASLRIEEELPLIERKFILSLTWHYQLPQMDVENEELADILGPLDAFTIHGLCETNKQIQNRVHVNVTEVLRSPELNNNISLEITGEELLSNLKTSWKDKDRNDEFFWEMEYYKHGGSSSYQDVYDYFKVAYQLYEHLNLIQLLDRHLALPSLISTFSKRTIHNVLRKGFQDHAVQVICKRKRDVEEFRFYYRLTGPFSFKNFRGIDSIENAYPPTCDKNGLRLPPKGAWATRKTQPRLFGYIRCQSMMQPSEETGFLTSDGLLELGALNEVSELFELKEVVAGFYELFSGKGSCGLFRGRLVCNKKPKTTMFMLSGNGHLEADFLFSWHLGYAHTGAKRTVWLGSEQSFSLIFKFAY